MILHTLPDESVHCCVTSPPYWGLRDYGTGTWEGGNAECDHQGPMAGGFKSSGLNARKNENGWLADDGKVKPTYLTAYRGVCGKCDACRIDQQLGLEQTPEEYVAKMVEVFREVQRVLSKDGTLWVNMGDCYSAVGKSGGGEQGEKWTHTGGQHIGPRNGKWRPAPDGLKPKDLCGIPWRVAFALQADGWYLRCDIIWSKPNPMPESVTDRPTKAHEYLFLLAKSGKYYYNAEAIREAAAERDDERPFGNAGGNRHGDEERIYRSKKPDGWDTGPGGHGSIHRDGRQAGEVSKIRYGRNRRTVWTIATQPYKEAHFATFPEELVRPCILAGCPEGGTVLDPFAGSGTVGKVAEDLGRNSILIELNPKYIEMIKKRTMQQNIFLGNAPCQGP